MTLKKTVRLILLIFVPVIFLITACNVIITRFSKGKLFDHISEIPTRKTGLLLGTSKYISRGKLNPYFSARIRAAGELYHQGKIHYLILSGDNRHQNYNEPRDMRKALNAIGVPDSVIFPDYAGFRTFDSVIRSKKIFGQDSIIVISQHFHNMRAVFIAWHFGIHAIGFNAGDVYDGAGFKTKFREVFARTKVFLDIYILKTKPYFLGDRINIPD